MKYGWSSDWTCVSCTDTDMIDFRGTSVLCAYADILKEICCQTGWSGTNENVAELGNVRHFMGNVATNYVIG